MKDFYGYPIQTLSSQAVEIDCLATAGPRIVRLSYKGSPNLFAELPENITSTTFGDYRYLGGHRLWHSPEAMPRSYIPDLDGLTFTVLPFGLLLDGRTEPATGIRKSIQVQLNPEQPIVRLTHTLTNTGLWEVELAPWALTMFRLGGTVILPIAGGSAGPDALLPDRRISLWSYTRIHDPRLRLEDAAILVDPRLDLPPLKIGAFSPPGWIAYWLDGILFRKTFEAHAQLHYPDFGCNAETYCDSEFVELESLGPLTRLAPGSSVSHIEIWELYESLEQDFIPAQLRSQILEKSNP